MPDFLIEFFKKENLFNLSPKHGISHIKIVAFVLGLIFILSLLQYFLVTKKSRNAYILGFSERILYFLIALIVSIVLFITFRSQGVYLFSSNIVAALGLLMFAVWLFYLIFIYYFRGKGKIKELSYL